MAYPTYNNCPRVYARNPKFFGNLIDQADFRPLRLLVIDDSQGTQLTPYITHLMELLYKRYGNMPETPICLGGNNFPSKTTSFNFEADVDGSHFGRVPIINIFPEARPITFKQKNIGTAGTDSKDGVGILSVLDHKGFGSGSAGDARLAYGRYFHTEDSIQAKIWASTFPSSPALAWNYRPTGGDETNLASSNPAWSAIAQSGTVFANGELNDGSSYLLKSALTPTLVRSGGTFFHQIQLYSNSSSLGVDIWGCQWINQSRRYGIAVHSMSGGGYTPAVWMTNSANAKLNFQTFGPFDAVVINLGVNNEIVFNDATATTFYNQLYGQGVFDATTNPNGSLIDTLRNWSGNPQLPIFLCPDQYSWNGTLHPTNPSQAMTVGEQAIYDQQAGVEYTIAQNDPYTCFINTRLMGDENGWNAQGVATWTVNTTGNVFIHPNADGGWMHAQIVYNGITAFSRRNSLTALAFS